MHHPYSIVPQFSVSVNIILHRVLYYTLSCYSDALLQFTEARYSRVESKRFIQPQLQLSMTIAVDLVVEVIPLNLTFARASGQLPTSLDPIQTDPNFDPLTQTATSKLRSRLLSAAKSWLSLTIFHRCC